MKEKDFAKVAERGVGLVGKLVMDMKEEQLKVDKKGLVDRRVEGKMDLVSLEVEDRDKVEENLMEDRILVDTLPADKLQVDRWQVGKSQGVTPEDPSEQLYQVNHIDREV